MSAFIQIDLCMAIQEMVVIVEARSAVMYHTHLCCKISMFLTNKQLDSSRSL